MTDNLTPAQKGAQTRALNALNKSRATLAENKLVENAFVLRQSIIESITDESRNIDEECGYPTSLDVNNYQTIYDRNGIGTRLVRLWPEECWSVTPKVVEDSENTIKGNKDLTEFEKQLKILERGFHLNSILFRLDVLSGIGRFGVLLIGINDGKKLDEPVDGFDEKTGKISGKNYELTYLKPLSEYVIMLKKTVNDVMSPRYGMPELYTLNNVDIETGTSENNVTVHWTRVIHIADNKGISDVFGVPRLQPVVNYVLDCKKLLGSSAEMFWKGGFPGIAFEIDKERQTSLTAAEKKSLRSEFLDYTNKLQRYMALVGVTAKSLEVQVADPSPHFLAYLKAIAITYGVPYRKLIGSEEAKLASAEDSKTWNRRVTRRQNEHVSSGIIRLLIDRFIGLGILPEVEYDVTWPPLSEDDPKEQSEISKNKVDAIAKYMTSGADALIEPKSFFTTILGMEEGEADEIIDATEIWVDDHIDESELEDDMSNPNDGDNNGKNQQPKN